MQLGIVALLISSLTTGPLAIAAEVPGAIQADLGKPVYLDFWASWCGPCAQSFPWLNQMHRRYGDRVTFIGINVDTQRRDAARFLKRYPAQFKLTFDPSGELARQYRPEAMPSAILLDAQGREIWRHAGFRSDETAQYEAAIQEALK